MATSVSIIIPCFNDQAGLQTTLRSLEHLQDAHDFEVLAVDNGSTDGTWEWLQTYADETPHLQALQEREIQSSYAARNRGLRYATGDVLAFIDADMSPPSHYLSALRERFDTTPVDYLACNVEIPAQRSSLSALYNSLNGFPVDRYLARGHYAPTCALVIRRTVIDLVGPFDPRVESGGDMEFGQRCFLAGLNQAFAPEITLQHPPRTTLRALINKERRIARGHAQLTYLYPERYSLFRDLYLGSTKYIFPSNPLAHRTRAQQKGLTLQKRELAALSLLHFPISWAGLFSYVNEWRRLKSI